MDILHRMILREAPAHLAFTGPTMEQFRTIFIPCNMFGAATVSNKTVPITNPNTVREAHCNHMWEFRLALV